MKNVIFCWLSEITLSLHPPNQPHVTNADKSLATWKMIMIYFKWRIIFCWLTEITLSLHSPNQPQTTNADKNLATWGRIQGDERWWWSTSNEGCHLLLTQWNHFIPSSPKSTPRHNCGTKPSHLRSHSRRRKMMMIYFKWRVSSFADSLKSLYPFLPEINPTSQLWNKA